MLISVLFLLVCIMVIVIVFSCRNKPLSEKNRERVKTLKSKLQYNPVIRYLLLNSLKFNYSALCVFKQTDAGVGSVFLAILLLLFINICPLIFSRILYKNHDKLKETEIENKIGTLYEGRNVETKRKHRAWVFPLVFFGRRLVFIVFTVALFDYPSLQMIMHQILSLGMLAYLLLDQYMFVQVTHHLAEFSTEAFLLIVSTLMQ